MIIKKQISVLFVLFALCSCEIKFVADPINPRVLKYTHQGYDVSGALINDTIWRSNLEGGFWGGVSNKPMITASSIGDSVVFSFDDNTPMSFHFSGIDIKDFEDLKKLKGKKIILDGDENYASYNYVRDYTPLIKGSGQVYFREVSRDNDQVGVNDYIISGTFYMDTRDENGEPIEIRYGRFDYEIDISSNFILR